MLKKTQLLHYFLYLWVLPQLAIKDRVLYFNLEVRTQHLVILPIVADWHNLICLLPEVKAALLNEFVKIVYQIDHVHFEPVLRQSSVHFLNLLVKQSVC